MEEPVCFDNDGEKLRGVLHMPDGGVGVRARGVVFLHGWSGCRLGPHRMFVKAARRLAADGCACLRFDFRGRGESDGSTAAASIASMVSDAERAVAFLIERGGVREVVLLGICSGGKVAVAAATTSSHVGGLALWSAEAPGPLRSSATNARKSAFALRDYARKLARPETWRKILSLRVNVGLVRKALVQHEAPGAEELRQEALMVERFRSFRQSVLFVYGGNDPDTKLAAENYRRFCLECGIPHQFHEIAEANHSFYSLDWEKQVVDHTVAWLAACRQED